LTKTTPEDNLKRLTDKCRELLLEVEAQEAQLHSQSGHIQAEQAALRDEVVRAMNELLQVSQSPHITSPD